MKVKVSVQVKQNPDYDASFDLVLSPNETPEGVKERVLSLQKLPFPDQDLLFDGKILTPGLSLWESGVEEGSSLVVKVKASEDQFVQQLLEIVKLQPKGMSCEELGLMYNYTHGAKVSTALEVLQFKGMLKDFVNNHKSFVLDERTKVYDAKNATIRAENSFEKIVAKAKEIFVEPEEDDTIWYDASSESEDEASKEDEKPQKKAGDASLVSKVDQILQSLGNVKADKSKTAKVVSTGAGRWQAAPAVEGQEESPKSWCKATAQERMLENLAGAENQDFLDLHAKVCSRAFNSKVVSTFLNIVDGIKESIFLNVSHVVKSGSVGNGTAISGISDAEAVFFLRGVPKVDPERWLQPMLQSAAGSLAKNLPAKFGVEGDISVTEDSLRMHVRGLFDLNVRFSPIFESLSETMNVMKEQEPTKRHYYNASLVEQRTQFVAKQPGSVKMTIRLLKWWRDQQEWSKEICRPSNAILELLAIYSAVQTKPGDQKIAIANVMALMSGFDQLRVVWNNFYKKQQVWEPLLLHRPLLMDPVNPNVNVADPQIFDPSELMKFAKSTRFFW
eukprot:TRINITY_DN109463_c0_g1_i1.p1 TRINITY_DN109463_c0_g1~~TRINITY_DN109463_c0_g1_i1.p1  ORF type:complete len:560 (-),score=123.90 TRINITY_DN109463_c0_g1_i1:97-1776(-)